MKCKFCHKEHARGYGCSNKRLWRKVREALNRNPNMEIIFTAAARLGLSRERNANHPIGDNSNDISNAQDKKLP